jgi:hypothetical protein
MDTLNINCDIISEIIKPTEDDKAFVLNGLLLISFPYLVRIPDMNSEDLIEFQDLSGNVVNDLDTNIGPLFETIGNFESFKDVV